ncbi:putative transcriptional regulator, ArsR family [Desulfosarcina variabilis str. Montpellier]
MDCGTNYTLTDGRQSAYAASILGNLRHWLNDEAEISALMKILPGIDRNAIVGKE